MRLTRVFILGLMMMVALAACGGGGDEEAPPAAIPTVIPVETDTPPPTASPLPSETFTPAPTAVPRSTFPPTFTPVPEEDLVVTAVPINPDLEVFPDELLFEGDLNGDGTRSIRMITTRGFGNREIAEGNAPTISGDGTNITYEAVIRSEQNGTERREAIIINDLDDDVDIVRPFREDGLNYFTPILNTDASFMLFARDNNADGLLELHRADIGLVTQSAIGSLPVVAGSFSFNNAGDRIVFVSEPTEDVPQGVYIMNTDGSGQTLLTTGTTYGTPVWSRDDSRLAFNCGADVCVINVDGSNLITLAANASDPSWSADGTQIAYDCGDVCLIASTGGEPQLITTGMNIDTPVFNFDGTKIAFASVIPTGWALNVFDFDDNSVSLVVEGIGEFEGLVFRRPQN